MLTRRITDKRHGGRGQTTRIAAEIRFCSVSSYVVPSSRLACERPQLPTQVSQSLSSRLLVSQPRRQMTGGTPPPYELFGA